MSIKVIMEALKAGPTEGPWTIEIGELPSVAIANDVMLLAKTLGGNDDANAAFIAACNPTAIRALLQRLDEAEAARDRYASESAQHFIRAREWAERAGEMEADVRALLARLENP